MVKRLIPLSNRKKLAASDFGVKVIFDGDYVKKVSFDFTKLTSSLLKQGMNADHGVQLRLQQPALKRRIKLMFGTVGTPRNPSSLKELVVSKFIRPKAVLIVYDSDEASESVGKIYGFANVVLPTSEDNLGSTTSEIKRSILPVVASENLRQKLFQLDIEHDTGPLLNINAFLNNKANPKSYLLEDKIMLGVILQSVVSEVFDYILASEDEPTWFSDWRELCKNKKISLPTTVAQPEDRRDLTRDIVDQFALDHLFLDIANKYISEKEDIR